MLSQKTESTTQPTRPTPKTENRWKIKVWEEKTYIEHISILMQVMPEVFDLRKIKHPFAVGIREEIVKAFPEINTKYLSLYLSWISSTPKYLSLVICGKHRRHLDGRLGNRPSEKHQQDAKEKLAERLEHYRQNALANRMFKKSGRSLRTLYNPEDVIPYTLMKQAGIPYSRLERIWVRNRFQRPRAKRESRNP